MTVTIRMPALSPTMTEGSLAKWLVKEGDSVASGDVIAEIETDKATMEVEAVDEGRIGKILVQEGTEGVAVNAAIAVLLEEGDDDSAIDQALASIEKETKGGDGAAQPPQAAGPKSNGAGAPAPEAAKPAPAPEAARPAPGAPSRDGRIFASPLARRMAAQAGLDLAALGGSGPHGRIVKADIEKALSAPAPAEKKAAAPAAAEAAPTARPAAAGPSAKTLADLLEIPYRQEKLSNVRKTIAARLTEAKQSVPHFYLTLDCAVDELLAVRKQLNARSDAYKLSVNDFVVRAAALALRKVPAANASWDETGILYYERADVSVAVAAPSGLITPIIKAADTKGLAQISSEMKDLAARAREGKLRPEEYQGGTFSVSNLGMYGIRDFAAILNPPQGCILAVGAGEQRPVVKDGAVAIATMMSCTLSVDHRVVDGAIGAEYLAAFKGLIEDPLSMLL
jgi:pyruvate dehydrogenase E2 component (dihydrolipoamide acetyltransferase)